MSQHRIDKSQTEGREAELNRVKRQQNQHEQNLVDVTAYLNHGIVLNFRKLSSPVELFAKMSLSFHT